MLKNNKNVKKLRKLDAEMHEAMDGQGSYVKKVALNSGPQAKFVLQCCHIWAERKH